MYFIFRSARSTMPQDAAGLDVSIPDGRGVRIEASKTKALAHVESEEEERRRIQRFDSELFLVAGYNGRRTDTSGGCFSWGAGSPCRSYADDKRLLWVRTQGFEERYSARGVAASGRGADPPPRRTANPAPGAALRRSADGAQLRSGSTLLSPKRYDRKQKTVRIRSHDGADSRTDSPRASCLVGSFDTRRARHVAGRTP